MAGTLVLRGTRSGRQALYLARARWSTHAGSASETRGRFPVQRFARLYPWQRRLSIKANEPTVVSRSNGIGSEAKEDQVEDVEISPLPSANSTSVVKAYAELAKARLSALVVTTTAAGFVAAGPLPLSTDMSAFAAVLVGTALCSSSAAAWNQIFEVSRDRTMKRTLQRPLVTGVLSTGQAVAAATTWGVGGTTLLWYGTDPVTTALGVGNIVLYAGVYTALKPITTLNTWVGAVVGAIPPVMGYSAAMYTVAQSGSAAAAATSTLTAASVLCDPIALTLASTLYLWQLPHFMALSYMYRADYTRGGFAMMPCHVHTGAASADEAATQTANVIVRYAWYLGAVPLVATAANVTSSMFALEGLVLNGYAIAVAHRFHRDRTNQNARAVFLTSLWYLPCTLMLFLLHSKSWDNDTVATKNDNALSQYIAKQIHAIRDKGREHCLHEQATVHSTGQACPVVLGTEKGKETVDQAAQTLVDVSADHSQTA